MPQYLVLVTQYRKSLSRVKRATCLKPMLNVTATNSSDVSLVSIMNTRLIIYNHHSIE
jgi:hypothetical protein